MWAMQLLLHIRGRPQRQGRSQEWDALIGTPIMSVLDESWRSTLQAPMFGWMLNLTSFASSVARPGFMATILVPNDDAVWYLLKQKGMKPFVLL